MLQNNVKRGGSYIDWIKNKKTIINSINKDVKCFQYATEIALNYEEIGKNLKEQRNFYLL